MFGDQYYMVKAPHHSKLNKKSPNNIYEFNNSYHSHHLNVTYKFFFYLKMCIVWVNL